LLMWILAVSYGLHLLATAVWLGSMALLLVLAGSALRQGHLLAEPWWRWQRRALLAGNSSLVLLLLSGFYQMTNDSNYSGFLVVDGVWAWAMLLKHVAYAGVVAVAAAWQFWLLPALERLRLLAESRPQLAQAALERLRRRERQLLWLNVGCGVAVLLLTAVLTAV
jgi:putative copper export protein